MSIEFRLKQLRDEIDTNVKEVLMKWNAKKVFLNEPFDEDGRDICTACLDRGQKRFLRYSYVNMDEAVYKCEKANCLFPFRNFKYKNYVDRTIFRYERIDFKDDKFKPEQTDFASPTKMESGDMDNFDIKWFDCPFDSESHLDNVLSSSVSDEATCDIKEIINDICNNVQSAPTDLQSRTNNSFHNEQPPKVPARRLSKCLKYIEHLSPQKTIFPLNMEAEEPVQPKPISPVKSSSKSKGAKTLLRKDRKVVKKKHKTNAESAKSLIMEPPSMGLLDWLGIINEIGPKKLREFEFATPAIINSNVELISEIEKTSVRNTQQSPILIEVIGTSESFLLNNNQQSDEFESSVLREPEKETKTTFDASESYLKFDQNNITPTANLTDPITNHVDDHASTQNQLRNAIENTKTILSDKLIPNAEPSSGECYGMDFHFVETEVKTEPETSLKNKAAYKYVKEWKIERLTQRQRQRREKTAKRTISTALKIPITRKNINIENEELFRGFKALKPFKQIRSTERALIWIKDNDHLYDHTNWKIKLHRKSE